MLDLLINSVVVGIGLSMDAVAVSMADGLSENNVKKKNVAYSTFFWCFSRRYAINLILYCKYFRC